jgi:hypothetical protein
VPPDAGHTYHQLILGQDQLARIDATERILTVSVRTDKGVPLYTLTIPVHH